MYNIFLSFKTDFPKYISWIMILYKPWMQYEEKEMD